MKKHMIPLAFLISLSTNSVASTPIDLQGFLRSLPNDFLKSGKGIFKRENPHLQRTCPGLDIDMSSYKDQDDESLFEFSYKAYEIGSTLIRYDDSEDDLDILACFLKVEAFDNQLGKNDPHMLINNHVSNTQAVLGKFYIKVAGSLLEALRERDACSAHADQKSSCFIWSDLAYLTWENSVYLAEWALRLSLSYVTKAHDIAKSAGVSDKHPFLQELKSLKSIVEGAIREHKVTFQEMKHSKIM